MKNIHLLIIDPQQDFCDPKGSLYVSGAEHDISRLTQMVNRIQNKISDIHVTLDSHHTVDIAHPIWWKNSKGENPGPYTLISAKDVENGTWTTNQPSYYTRSLKYVQSLEKNGRFQLVIWPPHCRIGSFGHAVRPELFDALCNWEKEFALVNYVTKGSNIWTEHYSAIVADVPDASDPGTQVNTNLIQTLMSADEVAIAGEASSHCVLNTVKDIATNFGDDSYVKKLVLLRDAMSPVPTFESFQDPFFKEMEARGARITTTDLYLK